MTSKTNKGFTSKRTGYIKPSRHSINSTESGSNLSESFLDSIDFKSMRRLGQKPSYSNPKPSINNNDGGREKPVAATKGSLSRKRKPIRGQMGTYLPAETAQERHARLAHEKDEAKHNNHENGEATEEVNDEQIEGTFSQGRRSTYGGELKPLRDDMYEIPSHSVMKFLGYVTRNKWPEALKLCQRFVVLQPENKTYRDFLVILQAMLIYKENMLNFDSRGMSTTSGSARSSLISKSDNSFDIEMVEDELAELTEQLQIEEGTTEANNNANNDTQQRKPSIHAPPPTRREMSNLTTAKQ